MNALVRELINELGTDECIDALAPEFTEEEERILAATAPQTAQMSLGQLQGYEAAYRRGTLTTGRTREDDLRHEAIRRELARRS